MKRHRVGTPLEALSATLSNSCAQRTARKPANKARLDGTRRQSALSSHSHLGENFCFALLWMISFVT